MILTKRAAYTWLEATVTPVIACDGTLINASYVYNWTQIFGSQAAKYIGTTLATTVSSSAIALTNTNNAMLQLNPYELISGQMYAFLFTVQTSTTSGIAWTYVLVQATPTPLVPIILGGNSSISIDSTAPAIAAVLDASKSYDPDQPQNTNTLNLFYNWTCKRRFTGSRCFNSPLPSTMTLTLTKSLFKAANDIEDASAGPYDFTLLLSNSVKNATAGLFLVTVLTPVVSVSIQPFFGVPNYQTPIIIRSVIVPPDSSDSLVSVDWVISSSAAQIDSSRLLQSTPTSL